MNNHQIASAILAQLGGNKFLAMTGAKMLVSIDNGLQLNIRGKNAINCVRIVLEADLYNLAFLSVRGIKSRTVASVDGIYCDQLQREFTEATGLYTSL